MRVFDRLQHYDIEIAVDLEQSFRDMSEVKHLRVYGLSC